MRLHVVVMRVSYFLTRDEVLPYSVTLNQQLLHLVALFDIHKNIQQQFAPISGIIGLAATTISWLPCPNTRYTQFNQETNCVCVRCQRYTK